MEPEADRRDPASPRRTSEPDWPVQATDAVVRLVDSVRDRTAGPATSVARGLVYGLLAAIVGSAALVVAVVVLLRAVEVGVAELLGLADIDRAGRSAWISHVLVGLAFVVPGLWVWRKGWRATATR